MLRLMIAAAALVAAAAMPATAPPRARIQVPDVLIGYVSHNYLEMETLPANLFAELNWTRAGGPTPHVDFVEFRYVPEGTVTWSIGDGTIYADTPYPCKAQWVSGAVKTRVTPAMGEMQLITDGRRVDYLFQLNIGVTDNTSGNIKVLCPGQEPATVPVMFPTRTVDVVRGYKRGRPFGTLLVGTEPPEPDAAGEPAEWSWMFSGKGWKADNLGPQAPPLKPASTTITVKPSETEPEVVIIADPESVFETPAEGWAILVLDGTRPAPGPRFRIPTGTKRTVARPRLSQELLDRLAAGEEITATLVIEVWYPDGPRTTTETLVRLTPR